MSGIGVVLNPHSRKYKQNPAKAKKMSFIVGDKASCRTTQDLDDLRHVAQDFKDREIDILAISGGDGTNHCTLTSFIDVYGDKPLPKIAILRGGTLNTVANSFDIKGTPEGLLSNLLVKYHEDLPFEERSTVLTKVNDEYGFIFGIGVIYNWMADYYKGLETSPLQAAKTLAHSIGSALVNGPFAMHQFERFDAEVTVDGKRWPFANYCALYSGTARSLGLNFRVFYLVDQDPTKFHAIGFSLPPRNILRYVPAMYAGRPGGCPEMLEELASTMEIKLSKPLPHTIDGDMKKKTDYYKITAGPSITLIVK